MLRFGFVGRNTNFQGSRDIFSIALKTKNFNKAADMFNDFKNDIDELLYQVS